MDRQMLKGRSILVILSAVLCCSLSVCAQLTKPALNVVEGTDGLRPSSPRFRGGELAPAAAGDLEPSVGDIFYEIASEIANSQALTASQAEQAIVLLTAARTLGSTADQILPLLITLACEHSQQDYSQQINRWLQEYVSESIDMEVAKRAILYLLDRLNYREQREQLLQELLTKIGGRNAALDSELYTSLGLLMVEKADFKAAQRQFIRAYLNNRYNKLAFAKLAELAPERIGPTIYLEHLRLALRENPLDIEAVLAFAQYCERLALFEVAAAAYQYSADLFSYIHPNEPLPADIYLPWTISNYNSAQNQSKCLQIAESVASSGRFDIFVEAIAGKAAAKIGNIQEARQILHAAEQKAQQLLEQGPRPSRTLGDRRRTVDDSSLVTRDSSLVIGAEQLAWFYCFAARDEAKALHWANKAFSTDPNSPMAAALLAYALVINQQLEWAKPLIENYEQNQIADLVQAQIQLTNGQRELAIETLKSAIAKDPGSLAAERAKEILALQGQQYSPPVDANVILNVLRNSFGQAIVPEFTSPDKIISVQFNPPKGGNEFSYGSEFSGTIVITNNSSEPLVISDNGLFKGNIRIDADISGDLDKKIPKLISHKIVPAQAGLIEPGRSILTSVSLVTGELRRILFSYPQASLDIEFTLYFDRGDDQREITNRLTYIKPARLVVRRPGVDLTSAYLRNRFNSISTGQTGQRIRIARLFVGLLAEQHAMAEHGVLYRYKYAPWMPGFLKSALLQSKGLLLNPADNHWPVKVHTMAEMLSLPLDHQLINAVAKNLNDPKWPVRMMAVYLLAKGADGRFSKVLDWTAKNDSNPLVRNMAVALSADFGQLSR
ncbi:MAG: hypothetical protein ACE5NM_02845 [Sedimentisphaerales bacterium]